MEWSEQMAIFKTDMKEIRKKCLKLICFHSEIDEDIATVFFLMEK